MRHFAIYTPKATPTPPAITIIDLIPIGRDNAISRDYLDYTVLNLSRGEGYYRPSRDDLQDLQRYIRQEENRAKSTFRNISNAKALYEDYKHGRIEVS